MTIPYDVKLYDEEPNGVSHIVSLVLQENLGDVEGRVEIARRMPRPISIIATDQNAAATLVFGKNDLTIYNGIVGRPSVVVSATIDEILEVTQLKMVGKGLIPVGLLFTKRGMKILLLILKHKLVVKGLILHPITVLQLIGIVSVAE